MANARVVTATWLRTHLKEIFRDVEAGQRFIVERDRVPTLVILSVDEYERLQNLASLARFYELSRLAGEEAELEGLTEDKLQAEIAAIKQQVFAERYGNG